jgi:nucleotide-binding universal stress UspA family protein
MAQLAHLLAATDLTGRSANALQRAIQLRAESDSQVTVLHVVEHDLTAGTTERRRADALSELEHWHRSLTEAAQPGVSVDIVVGDPFAAIVDELRVQQADLAVIGGPGKRGLKELFTGTTAERVVRFADRPVLMVNRHPNGPYKRVLIAMDFSEGAKLALEWARRIAPGAEIQLVHAWQPLVGGRAHQQRETEAANRRLREQEEQQLRAVIKQVAPALSLPLEIEDDEPYAALRNRIGTFGADLLAMGTHSRSRLSTAIVGSLAREFLAAAPCDVLVARGS